jgi:hypothetical protein
MSLKLDHFQRGICVGIRYETEGTGFGIQMHSHADPLMHHNILCAKGDLIVFGDDWFHVVPAGHIIDDFENDKPHAITSLGPAVWFNFFVNGIPELLARMTEGEKHTIVHSPVEIPEWILKEIMT